MTLLIFLTEKEKDLYLARTAGPELVASKVKFFLELAFYFVRDIKPGSPTYSP